MNREKFMEEVKLRKMIKENIKSDLLNETKDIFKDVKEELKLRTHIRKLILKESEEDRPHHSTGINVLSDLLKKIVPVVEIDYKKITSNPAQRQSYRAHLLKATTSLLTTEAKNDEADDESEVSDSIEQHSDSGDVEISLEETEDEVELDPEMEKFIDVEKSQKKPKKPKEKEEDTFTIQGEDMTGRNLASSTFDKIETSIQDAYGILSDEEDKRLFHDYLIVNFKLYFDRWENALKTNVQEPDSEIYNKEKDQGDAPMNPSI